MIVDGSKVGRAGGGGVDGTLGVDGADGVLLGAGFEEDAGVLDTVAGLDGVDGLDELLGLELGVVLDELLGLELGVDLDELPAAFDDVTLGFDAPPPDFDELTDARDEAPALPVLLEDPDVLPEREDEAGSVGWPLSLLSAPSSDETDESWTTHHYGPNGEWLD